MARYVLHSGSVGIFCRVAQCEESSRKAGPVGNRPQRNAPTHGLNIMKNRNCKWRLIGLATGWLFIVNVPAGEPAPDANATATNISVDANATVANVSVDANATVANVSVDANATVDGNSTAAQPKHQSAASQRIYGMPSSPESYQPKPVNLMEVTVRVFGALLVVIAILIGGAWWFRKSRLFGLVPPSQAKLKILETKSLGSRHAMHVVVYGEQRFLISDSPVGTSFLTHLDDPGEEPPEEEAAEEPEPGTFAFKLKTLISRTS